MKVKVTAPSTPDPFVARVVLAVGARGPPPVTYLFGSSLLVVHSTVPVTAPSTPDPIVARVDEALGARGSVLPPPS